MQTCDPPCLYISNLTSVIRIPLNKTTGRPLSGAKAERFFSTSGYTRSLEIDPIQHKIYWGDLKYHTINSSKTDGTQRQTLYHYAIGKPQGIALDWSCNNIYWTDSDMKVIEVSSIQGNNRKVLFTFPCLRSAY